jgi:hypothetical protein
MWDRAGQLGKSGEYRTGMLRVDCFHIQSSECDSPRLCRLRTDHLAPVNKIDYVLEHTGFMESHKFSSFDGRWVGRHPTVLHRWHCDSIRTTHGLSIEVFVWKTTLGYGRPGSTLWQSSWKVVTRVAFVAHVCRVARLIPCKVILYWFESPWHLRIWVRLVRCCHSVEVLFHHVRMRVLVMFSYDYLVVKINDTKNGWLSYYACLA